MTLPAPSLDRPAVGHKRPVVSQKESPALRVGDKGAGLDGRVRRVTQALVTRNMVDAGLTPRDAPGARRWCGDRDRREPFPRCRIGLVSGHSHHTPKPPVLGRID